MEAKFNKGDVVAIGDKERDRHLALGAIGAAGEGQEIGFNAVNGREYRIDNGSSWYWEKEKRIHLVCKAEDRQDR